MQFRIYDPVCVVVVPSDNLSYETDFDVMVIGHFEALIDPDGTWDGYNWGYFAYAPDTGYASNRPIGVRPHVEQPSCDPATYHADQGYTSTWRTAGYFYAGSWITVTEIDDTDGDGVLDGNDMCPGTTLGDQPERLKRHRFAANADGFFVDADGTESGLDIESTFGCDEDQIIDLMGLGAGHERFGITRSVLLTFTSMY